jgi:hypothetical protein
VIVRLIEKILRIPQFTGDDPPWERLKPDPPPWDVPLDQTTAPIHFQGDTSSM